MIPDRATADRATADRARPTRPGQPAAAATATMRWALVRLLVCLLAVGPVLGPAPPAGAHGGLGSLTLKGIAPAASSSEDGSVLEVSVELRYLGDGDPVPDATVTVAGSSSAGATLTPAPLGPVGEGVFTGTVTLPSPGTWNLRVTAVEPPATLDLDPVAVAPPVAPPDAADAPTATSAGVPDATSATTSATDPDEAAAPDPDEAGDPSSGGRGAIAAVLAALVVAAGVAWVLSRRSARTRPTRPTG